MLGARIEVAINGKSFLKINSKKKRVEGSEILKWYKEDFISNGQSEIDFLNSFRNEKIPSNFKLSYSPYNLVISPKVVVDPAFSTKVSELNTTTRLPRFNDLFKSRSRYWNCLLSFMNQVPIYSLPIY